MAITFEIGNNDPQKQNYRWKLEDVAGFVRNLGYEILHADDITARDIEIGWNYLQSEFSEQKKELTTILGQNWITTAQQELVAGKEEMIRGIVGNGRIITVKN